MMYPSVLKLVCSQLNNKGVCVEVCFDNLLCLLLLMLRYCPNIITPLAAVEFSVNTPVMRQMSALSRGRAKYPSHKNQVRIRSANRQRFFFLVEHLIVVILQRNTLTH